MIYLLHLKAALLACMAFNPNCLVLYTFCGEFYKKCKNTSVKWQICAQTPLQWGLSYCSYSTGVRKAWSWRTKWWVKRRTLTPWSRHGGFEVPGGTRNLNFHIQKDRRRFIFFGPVCDFKSRHIGSKVSDFDAWPTIWCTSIKGF